MSNHEVLSVILPSFIKINQCKCPPEDYKKIENYIDYVHENGWITDAEKNVLVNTLE